MYYRMVAILRLIISQLKLSNYKKRIDSPLFLLYTLLKGDANYGIRIS